MKSLLGVVLYIGVVASILFGAAGRTDLPFFWAVLGVVAVSLPISVFLMDPGLRRERFAPGPGGVSRAFRLLVLPLIIGSWVIAGLDVGRFHWSDSVPSTLKIAALVGLVPSMALWIWAIRANPFFSPVIRVQSERGHRVIASGPYEFIRHPGYAATVLVFCFATLALGSWLATALTIPYAAMFLHRTRIEERFLRENLPGYGEYAASVPARWLPGLW